MTFETSNFINFPCKGFAIKLLIVNMVPFLVKLFTPNIPKVNSTLLKESNPYVEGNSSTKASVEIIGLFGNKLNV